MTATVPKKVPASFIIGETLKFTRAISDYAPEDGWTLSYALVKSDALIEFSSSDNGDGSHLVNVAPGTTENYSPGTYAYQGKVTDGTDVYIVETGTIVVKQAFSTESSGYDDRSHVKKVLDALEATILGKASTDQLSYSIGNRSISKMSPEELIKWRGIYKQEYASELAAEKVANGMASGNKILVRF